jgi:hypothetical protein
MVGGSELATRVWVLPEERCVPPNQAPDYLINHNVALIKNVALWPSSF